VISQRIPLSHLVPMPEDFQPTAGSAVPGSVTLHPVPETVVEAVPEIRDYRYFVLADKRIVIVEPQEMRVVEVLEAQ
jgi:hypothetical protein